MQSISVASAQIVSALLGVSMHTPPNEPQCQRISVTRRAPTPVDPAKKALIKSANTCLERVANNQTVPASRGRTNRAQQKAHESIFVNRRREARATQPQLPQVDVLGKI